MVRTKTLYYDKCTEDFYKRGKISKGLKVRKLKNGKPSFAEFKIIGLTRIKSVIEEVITYRSFLLKGPDGNHIMVVNDTRLFENIKSKQPI